jgi:hypothetical protein
VLPNSISRLGQHTVTYIAARRDCRRVPIAMLLLSVSSTRKLVPRSVAATGADSTLPAGERNQDACCRLQLLLGRFAKYISTRSSYRLS